VDPLVVVFGGLVIVFVVGMLAIGRLAPLSGRRALGGSPDADAAAAQAEIEAVDIDQMIEARNESRRRRGLLEIGDELEFEIRRRPDGSS
jgi:hypothetical protein